MTVTAKNKYTITKENLEEFTDALAYAVVRTSNYNTECFGMSDLRLADSMECALDKFITHVREAGYCPYALLHNSLVKSDMYIKEEYKRPDLKQSADEELYIDMSEYKKVFGYVEYFAEEMKNEVNN